MAKWQDLTDSELEILSILWRRGPSTVREVIDELNQERPRGRTTTLKMMQLMHAKGLVAREESGRAHVYRATRDADVSRIGIVRELVSRLFGGNSRRLALSALGDDFTPDQLSEVERILEEMEEKKG